MTAPTVPASGSRLRQVVRPPLVRWLGLEVIDVDHVAMTGPVLIAATHRSHADSIAIGAALERATYFLGDEQLARWPGLRQVLPRLGMVAVRRGHADRDALVVLERLLGEGGCVAVYPEGSRSRDGRVHRLRSGVARLAAELAVPVVPAAVVGSQLLWPVDARPRLRGGKVTVRFGAPLPPPDASPRSRRSFTLGLQRELGELAGAELATTFAPPGGSTPGAGATTT